MFVICPTLIFINSFKYTCAIVTYFLDAAIWDKSLTKRLKIVFLIMPVIFQIFLIRLDNV